MKNKILFAIALMCTMLLTSCGGGDSDGGGSSSRPSTYYMDINLESAASSQTVVLSNLKTNVSTATSSASWLTPSRQAYTSGSPKITIEATANTSSSSRNCTVTVTTVDGGYTDTAEIIVKYSVIEKQEENDTGSAKVEASKEETSVEETVNTAPAVMESRAPKTGENMTFIPVLVISLMAGAGLIGYALFIRRKRNR
jgi:hypothetical protein